ncbi:Protein of unknown function (DUF563) [seawater metagenome]|uniref:Glycosyltransferase 61 catalytic domain-containing protein n=1 Tax=seawater metagenome TaxID=1561972 RepID=A0A5E8CM26_9ZZZZ
MKSTQFLQNKRQERKIQTQELLDFERLFKKNTYENFLESAKIIYNGNNQKVTQYILYNWEYNPHITIYENICSNGIKGDLQFLDDIEIDFFTEKGYIKKKFKKNNAIIPKKQEKIIYRINRFDTNNPYESFHSYFNLYFVISAFNINRQKLKIVIMDKLNKSNNFDTEFWSNISNDVVYNNDTENYKYNMVIASQTSGSSIICTKIKNSPIQGRGVSCNCKCELYIDFIFWIKNIFQIPVSNNNKIIIWCSRNDFNNRKIFRKIKDEDKIIQKIQEKIDVEIKKVEFNKLSFKESIEISSKSYIFIGAHGAGLIWSSFMTKESNLIEFFGNDRLSNNMHYRNIASFCSHKYNYFNLKGYDEHTLQFSNDDLNKLINLIIEKLDGS